MEVKAADGTWKLVGSTMLDEDGEAVVKIRPAADRAWVAAGAGIRLLDLDSRKPVAEVAEKG